MWDLIVLAVVNWAMARRIMKHPAEPFHRPVLLGFLVVLASVAPSLLLSLSQGGTAEVVSQFRQIFDRMNAGLALAGGDDAARKHLVEVSQKYFWPPFPGLLAVCWLFWLTLNVLVLRRVLAYFGKARGLSVVLGWSLPTALVLLFLLPSFALLGLDRMPDPGRFGLVKFLSANLLVLVLPCYLLQGVLVTQWNLLSRGVPSQMTWVGWAILLFFLGPLLPGVMAALILLGLLDTWFDLRRLNPPPAEPADSES